MATLAGKRIMVTGAGSGIGRALALGLAGRGAIPIVSDRDAEGLAETARRLGNRHHVFWPAFDVTDRAALAAFVHGAAADGLDGIINNAGLTVVAPFADCPAEAFDRVMDVNFNAVVEGCRLALPYLRARGEGWIVNISSVFGMMGFPAQSPYNASKFAVRGFTESLALELGVTDPGISVIRVHPGGIRTNVARNARVIALMPGQGPDVAAAFDKMSPTTPEVAAETILAGMERRAKRVLIGPDARVVDWMVRLFPVRHVEMLARFLR